MRDRAPVDTLRISVLITNHNYGQFLGDCLAGVGAQTRAPDQVVVVDDGSTDGSRALLARTPGIDVVLQDQQGQAGALDAAVAASTGDLLCLLDADDVFVPHKLERIAAFFAAHAEVQWLRHALELVDQQLRPLGRRIPPLVRSGPVRAHRGLIAERVLTAATSGLVMRRELAKRVFPLAPPGAKPEAFRLSRDADALLLARLTESEAQGYTLNEVLTLYRRHEKQMYPEPRAVRVLLERQIDVTEAVAAALGAPWDNGTRPSPCHKHEMILATLGGRPRFAAERTRAWLAGVRAIGRGLADRPAAAARQLAALTFAWAAPGAWLRKFNRGQAWDT